MLFLSGLLCLAAIFYSCQKKASPSLTSNIKEYDSVKFDLFFVEALRLRMMGNGGEAIKFFEQCIKINPHSSTSYYQMAQIVMENGNLNDGKKYLLNAIRIEPENLWYLLTLAGTYYQEHKIDSAIIYYEKAVEFNPEKEEMKLTLANLYSEDREFDKAGIIYESLDEKYGVNNTSTANYVTNLIRAGKLDEALNKVKLLLEEYPDEIMYNGLLAEIYKNRGEPVKAMEVYDKLMERNPDNPQTQLSLCDFLINEKKYEELLLMLNKVILNDQILKEDKITLFSRLIGIRDLVSERMDQLLIAMMILEAEYNNDQIILLLRPELLAQEKRYGEAAERLEEIIKAQPENYFAWEKMLLIYLDSKNYRKLEDRGKECASKFNRSFLAKLLYATGATENGNFNIAIEELKKAEILAGNDTDMKIQVMSIKADVLYKMKDYDNAFATFEEAIKNDNTDISVLNNFAYYLAEQNIRLKEAEEMARKVIETEKDNYTYQDTYGWILFKLGKIKEAEKIFSNIIQNTDAPDAEYFEHYGYILKKRKNCNEAILNWEQAIKLDSTKTNLIKEIENCESLRQ